MSATASGDGGTRSSSEQAGQLNGVARAREVEVARLDRGHDHGIPGAPALARADALRTSQHLQVVEHEDRALVPPHVLDGTRDLSVLYQERAVAGESGEQDRPLVHAADVPEARTQDAALGARDHVLDRRVPTEHLEAATATSATTAAAPPPAHPPPTTARPDPPPLRPIPAASKR